MSTPVVARALKELKELEAHYRAGGCEYLPLEQGVAASFVPRKHGQGFALRVAVGEPTVSEDAYRTVAQTLGDAAFVKTRGKYAPERWFVQRARDPDDGNQTMYVVTHARSGVKTVPRQVLTITGIAGFSREFRALRYLNGLDPQRDVGPALGVLIGAETANENTSHGQVADCSTSAHGLNDAQRRALDPALQCRVQVVHGPPGTGKTSVIGALLRSAVTRGESIQGAHRHHVVVVTSEKNLAIDAVAESLLAQGGGVESSDAFQQTVAVGVIASMGSSTKRFVLEHKVLATASVGAAQEELERASKELALIKENLAKHEATEPTPDDEIRILENNASNAEAIVSRAETGLVRAKDETLENLAENARVVLCTLGSIHRVKDALGAVFDRLLASATVICDEASTAHTGLFIGALAALGMPTTNIVAIGDNRQLPPYWPVHPAEVASLFDDALAVSQPVFLDIQYRMPRCVMDVLNSCFYESSPLVYGKADPELDCARPEWVDVPGDAALWGEYTSEAEAQRVIEIAHKALCAGSTAMLITPYRDQRDLIKSMLDEDSVVVCTVDGAQGQEADVVVVSLVKQKPTLFLNPKRVCVMLSRCRRELHIVGDRKAYRECQIPGLVAIERACAPSE